jgi:hypothetical protein
MTWTYKAFEEKNKRKFIKIDFLLSVQRIECVVGV